MLFWPPKRKMLTAYLSEDDGKTWPYKLLLDARGATYPDACQGKDGTLYVVHDLGRREEEEVIFHRITEADIKAGGIISTGSKLGDIANKALHPTLTAKAYAE